VFKDPQRLFGGVGDWIISRICERVGDALAIIGVMLLLCAIKSRSMSARAWQPPRRAVTTSTPSLRRNRRDLPAQPPRPAGASNFVLPDAVWNSSTD
jgi:hypothetical protein